MTRSYGPKWCNQRMQVFNVFDPSFERDANPEGFRCGYRKVAPKVGATELGATAYDLPPGQSVCPYHRVGPVLGSVSGAAR